MSWFCEKQSSWNNTLIYLVSKLFDSHCEASIIMQNTLLLCYRIMHGREIQMCSLDKLELILEKTPTELLKARWDGIFSLV